MMAACTQFNEWIESGVTTYFLASYIANSRDGRLTGGAHMISDKLHGRLPSTLCCDQGSDNNGNRGILEIP